MSAYDKARRREIIINSCDYRFGWIKDGKYKDYRRFPIDKLWRILRDLDSVGATPTAIGSSYDEFEAILQANGC